MASFFLSSPHPLHFHQQLPSLTSLTALSLPSSPPINLADQVIRSIMRVLSEAAEAMTLDEILISPQSDPEDDCLSPEKRRIVPLFETLSLKQILIITPRTFNQPQPLHVPLDSSTFAAEYLLGSKATIGKYIASNESRIRT